MSDLLAFSHLISEVFSHRFLYGDSWFGRDQGNIVDRLTTLPATEHGRHAK